MNTHNISNIISLREALHNVLEMAAENLESVVIAYSDGTYEAAPLASWREYAREEQGAEIFYTIRSLEEFGEDATADDIPVIIDEYILPALRSS